VNPAVVEAMNEVGISLSAQRPKILTDEAIQASDVVIRNGLRRRLPDLPRQALPGLEA
jgi:protein-tyrosine-phosphatase